MTQKVLQVGSSAAVTIPKTILERFGLRVGDKIRLDADDATRTIKIRPEAALTSRQEHIAKITLGLIERFRKDLEALAQK